MAETETVNGADVGASTAPAPKVTPLSLVPAAAAPEPATPAPEPVAEKAPPPIEDLSHLSNALTPEQLAALDAKDPVAAASIRSQMNWAEESKAFFPEIDAKEKARIQLLDDLGAREAEDVRLRRVEAEAKAKADEIAQAEALIAAQQEIIDDCANRTTAAKTEIKRLTSLKKAG